MLRNRINGHVLAEDVVDVSTGEIIAEAGTEVTRSLADDIQNAAVPYVWIQGETRNIKVLSSMMVDLRHYVDCNPKDLGITELVYYPVLKQLMDEYPDVEDLKEAIHKNVHDLIPKHITKDDILHPSTITCIWSTASVMMTISIIWVTDVSVRSENCYRTSTVSVFPDWREWSVRE